MRDEVRRILAVVTAAAPIVCFAGPALAGDAAPSPKIVGETISQNISVKATVEAIDLDKRMVTLKDEDGKITDLKVGPEVRNLPQVKKGDVVVATYHEAIGYEVHKAGTKEPGSDAASVAGRAKPGSMPAAGLAEVQTVTSTVEAIDKAKSEVTLKGPQGHSVTIKVKEPKRLDGVNVGDLVEITYTQALAISVQTPKK
jgi:hypothetical protein